MKLVESVHLPQAGSPVQVWRNKSRWLSDQLHQTSLLPGTKVEIHEAHEVFDETLADQFRIMAGKPRGPISFW